MLFHQSAAQAMKKRVIITHFTAKIKRTYLYINCNRKFYLLKNILAYCGYSPTSPFFFLLSEHKHCDNTATNSNSENARSRMVAILRGSVGMGTKEDE
jgi:putative NADPH-quinone reductase